MPVTSRCPSCGHESHNGVTHYCYRCHCFEDTVPVEPPPPAIPPSIWWRLFMGAVAGVLGGLVVYLIVAGVKALFWVGERRWAPTDDQVNNHQVYTPAWHWPPLVAIFVPVAVVVAGYVAVKIDD